MTLISGYNLPMNFNRIGEGVIERSVFASFGSEILNPNQSLPHFHKVCSLTLLEPSGHFECGSNSVFKIFHEFFPNKIRSVVANVFHGRCHGYNIEPLTQTDLP